MTDIENARLSGRHGAAWRELGIDAPVRSPFDGLRTLALIVVLSAAIVAWVVVAWWRA
jgi:hypothetical protein